MDMWEYQVTNVRLAQIMAPERKSHWEWVEDQPDGSLLPGMKTILDKYGKEGWELVSMIPQYWEGTVPGQWATADVRIYKAVFKRQA